MSADESVELPKPSFEVLVQVLVSPCFVHLGIIENPATGERQIDLVQARWAIDLLHVLQEKSEGERTTAETELLETLLKQLHDAYLQCRG